LDKLRITLGWENNGCVGLLLVSVGGWSGVGVEGGVGRSTDYRTCLGLMQ